MKRAIPRTPSPSRPLDLTQVRGGTRLGDYSRTSAAPTPFPYPDPFGAAPTPFPYPDPFGANPTPHP